MRRGAGDAGCPRCSVGGSARAPCCGGRRGAEAVGRAVRRHPRPAAAAPCPCSPCTVGTLLPLFPPPCVLAAPIQHVPAVSFVPGALLRCGDARRVHSFPPSGLYDDAQGLCAERSFIAWRRPPRSVRGGCCHDAGTCIVNVNNKVAGHLVHRCAPWSCRFGFQQVRRGKMIGLHRYRSMQPMPSGDVPHLRKATQQMLLAPGAATQPHTCHRVQHRPSGRFGLDL